MYISNVAVLISHITGLGRLSQAVCQSLWAPNPKTDMATFENQKEESLTTEAKRADNRGPTIEARRADKLKSS